LAAARGDLQTALNDLFAERNRVLRARAKWADDRTSLENAKASLAAALRLIEEAENRSLE
jgi:hypothetical protein